MAVAATPLSLVTKAKGLNRPGSVPVTLKTGAPSSVPVKVKLTFPCIGREIKSAEGDPLSTLCYGDAIGGGATEDRPGEDARDRVAEALPLKPRPERRSHRESGLRIGRERV